MRESGCRLIQNLGDSEVGTICSFRRAVDAVGSWSPFTEVTAVGDLGVLELGVRRLSYPQRHGTYIINQHQTEVDGIHDLQHHLVLGWIIMLESGRQLVHERSPMIMAVDLANIAVRTF